MSDDRPIFQCNRQLLSSYVDDEVSGEQKRLVEEHLRDCTPCTRELQDLRVLSAQLRSAEFDDISDDELLRAHEAVEAADDVPIWRLGGTLAVIAASILVISSVWLSVVPAPLPMHPMNVARGPEQPWERMAVTMRAEPVMGDDGQIQVAEVSLDEWMLERLKRGDR